MKFLTTHPFPITVHNLGQIGLKQREATEAYDQYAAGSFDEADAQGGLKCEQLLKFLKYISIALLYPLCLNAGLPEFYGSASKNAGIGNQAVFPSHEAGNLYYAPALAAWTKNPAIDINFYKIDTNFKEIDGVVVQNSINGQSASEIRSSVNTKYPSTYHCSLHSLFPLPKKYSGLIGISAYFPMDNLLETNSGSPFLPEYIMYRSRYNRSTLHINHARPLNKTWAWSIGAHLGFQASANINTLVSLNQGVGSSASMKSTIAPKIKAILSLAHANDQQFFYFTYKQEMKTTFKATALGDITNPSFTLIDIGINSLLFYDPHTFHFGYGTELLKKMDLIFSIDYQLWKNYKSPVISVINNSGPVENSSNFEVLKLRNIFHPRLGVQYRASENIDLTSGLAYRPTPLKGDFSDSGNSLDSDSFIFSAGLAYKTKIFKKTIRLALSGQYHKLKEKKISKTDGQENGLDGLKIGAPGYHIGGSVLVIQSGFNLLF